MPYVWISIYICLEEPREKVETMCFSETPANFMCAVENNRSNPPLKMTRGRYSGDQQNEE
jgi:hypothetical protein